MTAYETPKGWHPSAGWSLRITPKIGEPWRLWAYFKTRAKAVAAGDRYALRLSEGAP